MPNPEPREALRILLDRATRGALLVDEAELLRQHVEAELAAGDKARTRADIWKERALEMEDAALTTVGGLLALAVAVFPEPRRSPADA